MSEAKRLLEQAAAIGPVNEKYDHIVGFLENRYDNDMGRFIIDLGKLVEDVVKNYRSAETQMKKDKEDPEDIADVTKQIQLGQKLSDSLRNTWNYAHNFDIGGY